tara:strand:- start:21946 stop:22713 length:768 start_codon:yes stop_codon:yes gene_type:complete
MKSVTSVEDSVTSVAAEDAPLVGIVDTGLNARQMLQAQHSAAFVIEGDHLWQAAASEDVMGHGSRVCEVIQSLAPGVRIASAAVFTPPATPQPGTATHGHAAPGTTALQVAAAIHWLVDQGAQIINLSLGLAQDREVLKDACAAALNKGVILCAASPAQGNPVYPAAYPGVIRATGDARCQHQQISFLNTAQADVAGCVRPMNDAMGASGASMGCAHISAHIAGFLADNPGADVSRVLHWLNARADWHGREFRHA